MRRITRSVLRRRRTERKALRLARMLSELDDRAGRVRPPARRQAERLSLGLARP